MRESAKRAECGPQYRSSMSAIDRKQITRPFLYACIKYCTDGNEGTKPRLVTGMVTVTPFLTRSKVPRATNTKVVKLRNKYDKRLCQTSLGHRLSSALFPIKLAVSTTIIIATRGVSLITAKPKHTAMITIKTLETNFGDLRISGVFIEQLRMVS